MKLKPLVEPGESLRFKLKPLVVPGESLRLFSKEGRRTFSWTSKSSRNKHVLGHVPGLHFFGARPPGRVTITTLRRRERDRSHQRHRGRRLVRSLVESVCLPSPGPVPVDDTNPPQTSRSKFFLPVSPCFPHSVGSSPPPFRASDVPPKHHERPKERNHRLRRSDRTTEPEHLYRVLSSRVGYDVGRFP